VITPMQIPTVLWNIQEESVPAAEDRELTQSNCSRCGRYETHHGKYSLVIVFWPRGALSLGLRALVKSRLLSAGFCLKSASVFCSCRPFPCNMTGQSSWLLKVVFVKILSSLEEIRREIIHRLSFLYHAVGSSSSQIARQLLHAGSKCFPHRAACLLCPGCRGKTPRYQPCRGRACGKRRQCCSQTRGGAGRLLLWRLQLCLFRQNWIPIAAAGFGNRTARASAAFSHWSWLEKASPRVLIAALLPSPGPRWLWIHKWACCDKRVFIISSYPVSASTGGGSSLGGLAARCAAGCGSSGRELGATALLLIA